MQDDQFTEVSISNKGIGPARIKTVSVMLDDEPASNWWDVVGKTAGLGEEGIALSNTDAAGRVMASGESLMLVRVDRNAIPGDEAGALEVRDRFRQALGQDRIRMTVCYCSVFDDCWQVDMAVVGEASAVRACGQNAEGVSF